MSWAGHVAGKGSEGDVQATDICWENINERHRLQDVVIKEKYC